MYTFDRHDTSVVFSKQVNTHRCDVSHCEACKTQAEYLRSVAAKLFGAMVKESHETIYAYHSDLYHDALWLHEHMEEIIHEGKDAYWCPYDSGSRIGFGDGEDILTYSPSYALYAIRLEQYAYRDGSRTETSLVLRRME